MSKLLERELVVDLFINKDWKTYEKYKQHFKRWRIEKTWWKGRIVLVYKDSPIGYYGGEHITIPMYIDYSGIYNDGITPSSNYFILVRKQTHLKSVLKDIEQKRIKKK